MDYVCECMDCGKDFEININENHIVCPKCGSGDIYIENEEEVYENICK